MLCDYIVDDQGRWWEASAWELRRHLFLDDTASSSSKVAIQSLGYIGVKMGTGLLTICFDASRVTPVACASLYLVMQQFTNVRISVNDVRSPQVIHGSKGTTSAVQLIGDLVARGQYHRHPRFRASRLAKVAAGPLAPLLEALPAESDVPTEAEVTNAIAAVGLRRYLVVRRDRPTTDITIVRAGELVNYPPAWRKAVVGTPIRRFPDGELAQWANVAYRSALETKKFALERVDANVIWPRHGAQRHKYVRLIQPVRAADQRDTAVVVFA